MVDMYNAEFALVSYQSERHIKGSVVFRLPRKARRPGKCIRSCVLCGLKDVAVIQTRLHEFRWGGLGTSPLRAFGLP